MRLFASLFASVALMSAAIAAPTPDDPFRPDFAYQGGVLTATFTMDTPDKHIYDDMLSCSLGQPATKPVTAKDPDGRDIYEGIAAFTWTAKPGAVVTLSYQGCDKEQCYMPQEITYTVPAGTTAPAASADKPALPARTESKPEAKADTPAFPAMIRTATGYVKAAPFVRFLEGSGDVSFTDDPMGYVKQHGIGLFLLLVFVGGLLLNLTPCVLPMMPINLAIIGAGAAGGSRLKGALRGGAYGLGIALAYGVLALIPVLTGAAFGTIQSAWWFNAIIALVFLALSLALFDVRGFMIDFARFGGTGSSKQGSWAAFAAGALSAILAGACVAPVLIAVLLITSAYFAEGAYWALFLPFVLGLGMALPWPIAGAGLSFLPKPGAWMLKVKKAFGILVLLFAAYYGYVAVKAFNPPSVDASDGHAFPTVETDATDPAGLLKAIADAKKPILLDFWGTACKNCEAMDATTMKDPEVVKTLKGFTVIRVRMDLMDKAIRPVQEGFGIKGLPTYGIIEK